MLLPGKAFSKKGRWRMNKLLACLGKAVKGVLTGFDRIVFKGTILPLAAALGSREPASASPPRPWPDPEVAQPSQIPSDQQQAATDPCLACDAFCFHRAASEDGRLSCLLTDNPHWQLQSPPFCARPAPVAVALCFLASDLRPRTSDL